MTAEAGALAEDRSQDNRHDAFISYHRESSHRAALRLQKRLEDIARRNRIEPGIDLFLDDTGLRFGLVDQELSGELSASRRLVVLLHSETPRSTYVSEEIRLWLNRGGSPSRLILARVDDRIDLTWDRSTQGVVHEDQLPEALYGVFDAEPLWIDFAPSKQRRGRDDAGQLARLCATLVERSPEDLLQRELVAQRRRTRTLAGGLLGVAILLVVSVVASVLAIQGRTQAREQQSEAEAQAAAAEALLVSGEQPARSVDLLITSSTRSHGRSVRAAIYQVLEQNDRLQGLLPMPATFGGRSPSDIVFSPSGHLLAGWRVLSSADEGPVGLAVWDLATRAIVAEGTLRGPALERVEYAYEDTLVYCDRDGVGVISVDDDLTRETVLPRPSDGVCDVQPMRGGAYGVSIGGGVLNAVFVDADGDPTAFSDVPWVASGGLSQVAVVGQVTGSPLAVDAGGQTVATLTGLGGPQPGQGPLLADDRGTIIVRNTDGRVLRSGALEADPTAHTVGIPDGALAVSELHTYEQLGYVWLSADGTLGWTFGPQTLDLSSFLPAAGQNEGGVAPKIWIDRYGTSAVIGFADSAATVRFSLPISSGADPEPSMTLGERNDSVSTLFSDRTEIMGTYEQGLDAVALPTGADDMLVFSGYGDPKQVSGSVVFDPTGRVAVTFGDAPLMLLNGEYGGPWTLTQATDTNAIAFSRTGDVLAAVGPTTPVALYATGTQDRLPSLVDVDQDRWSAASAFGTTSVRPGRDGTSTVWLDRSDDPTPVDLGDFVRGVYVMSPDGTDAVVVTTDNTSAGEATQVAAQAGASEPVPDQCAGEDRTFRYVPGVEFRTDAAAAERQYLVAVDANGTTVPCTNDGDVGLVAVGDLFDYQLGQEVGRIVARRPDGAIDVTTWPRGGEPTSAVLPDTDANSAAAVDDAGRLAATWVDGSSTVNLFRSGGDGHWAPDSSVTTSIGDILTVVPDANEGLVTVVGRGGTIESFDLDTSRLLYRREVDLSTSGYSDDGVVRSASATSAGDDYIIRLGTGRETGPITNGMRVTAVSDVDRLRQRLCEILPTDDRCDG